MCCVNFFNSETLVNKNQKLLDDTGSFSSSTLASSIAKTLNFMGGAFTIDAGEASSLATVENARNRLLSGSCDLVLCAGAQRYMGIDGHEWYSLRGLLHTDGENTATGFHLAEGAGVVLLKRLSDAKRDGDRILGIIREIGVATNTQAIDEAIQTTVIASLEKNPLGLLSQTANQDSNPGKVHGHPFPQELTKTTSEQSAKILTELFDQIGHSLGASGIANLIRATYEIQNKPGADAKITKGVLSYSFDGLAYHTVLHSELVETEPKPVSPVKYKICRFSANTLEELQVELNYARNSPEFSFEHNQVAHFNNEHTYRLACVTDSESALVEKLKLVEKLPISPNVRPFLEEQGIFFAVKTQKPRIAFLFPGQGSQYQFMLTELIAECPAAAEKAQEIDTILTSMGHPTFSELVKRSNRALTEDVWATQMSLLAADTIAYAALVSLGIRPDVLAGHSFGEYVALMASGAWTLEQTIRITDARCNFISADHNCHGLFFTTDASREVIEHLCELVSGMVCIAIENAKDRLVVGGEHTAAANLQHRLTELGYKTKTLAVPRPFHTPLMAGISPLMAEFLNKERIQPPAIPLLSCVTNRYTVDPEDILNNLVAQMTQPMSYKALLERLAADGVTVFIEVGPQQVLSSLSRRILPAETGISIIAIDNPKRPGWQQLLRVSACLEVAGMDIGTLQAQNTNVAIQIAKTSGPIHPILRFDASEKRRRKHLSSADTSPVEITTPISPAAQLSNAPEADSMEKFLINFICEQTGYPPEVIQLEADLEADLGIDSLKKAQLFGELREHFQLPVDAISKISLNDFPTLHHVLNLLRSTLGETANISTTEHTAKATEATIAQNYPISNTQSLISKIATHVKSSEVIAVSSDSKQPLMSRFVFRLIETPLADTPAHPKWHGYGLIIGEGPTATALRNTLLATGLKLLELNLSQAIRTEEVILAFKALHTSFTIAHLFLVLPREEAASCGWNNWAGRRERGIILPYLLCQQWTSLLAGTNLENQATLVATTAMGGKLGLDNCTAAVEGGGIAGLLKSIRREFNGILIKLVDAPIEESPESIVLAVIKELVHASPELEIAYEQGRRSIVRAIPRALHPLQTNSIQHGSNWIISGGARSITAFVARELGKRYGLRLHLLGRSSLIDIQAEWLSLSVEQLKQRKQAAINNPNLADRISLEEWTKFEHSLEVKRNLLDLENLGIEAYYYSCNIGDRQAVTNVLDQVRAKFGPINGIIHGAGFEHACRFERKQLDKVQATIGAKNDGAANLMALTQSDQLSWFIAFGSISGRFGGVGQTDYALAGDLLAKQIMHYRESRPECKTFIIDWPAWDEAGMSVRPETKIALDSRGFAFMSSAEGCKHLINEIEAGAPEGEIMILDDAKDIDLDGIMPLKAQYPLLIALEANLASLPMLAGIKQLTDKQLVSELSLDPSADAFLYEHKYLGSPLLPAVISIESLAEAAHLLMPVQDYLELHEVKIHNALRFTNNQPIIANLTLRQEADAYLADISAEFRNRNNRLVDPHRVYVSAKLIFQQTNFPFLQLPLLPSNQQAKWMPVNYLDAVEARQESTIEHGPVFRCLEQICIEGDLGWGRIIAPPSSEIASNRQGNWYFPVALFDACLVACAIHSRVQSSFKQLPSGFGRIRRYQQPKTAELCTVVLHRQTQMPEATSYDFIVYGEEGQLILEVENHHSTILNSSSI
jgi:malonyl CoA-acyl carrier protein transacylase